MTRQIQYLGGRSHDDVVHLIEDDGRQFLATTSAASVVVAVVGGGMPGKVMKARAKIAQRDFTVTGLARDPPGWPKLSVAG